MAKEIKYYGIHACLALASKRPEDIIRVYLDESNVKSFGSLLKWCAETRRAYHIVSSIDLDKVSGSIHHEGVCILAKEVPYLNLPLWKGVPKKACLLYLDGLENPHNFGSILRTAAHFGIPYVLGNNFPLSSSACRIAKGGAEIVHSVLLKRPLDALRDFEKQGFVFIAASAHRGESLYRFSFPPRIILAIGSESKGLQSSICKRASHVIQIPGTGAIESLNVSVAAGLCIGEYCRQHG